MKQIQIYTGSDGRVAEKPEDTGEDVYRFNQGITGDKSVQTEKLIKRKDKIMDLDLKMRKAHVQRVNKGKCKASLTTPFTNILHLIDRMGNSCVNLADVASNEISLKYFMVN